MNFFFRTLCSWIGMGMVMPLLADDTSVKPLVIRVCEVALAEKPLKTIPASEVMRFGAGDEVEAHAPVDGQEWIVPLEPGWHPFLEAAHHAFADHRPLALSPDMIWQLLCQMVADEVHADPKKFRKVFADHQHGRRSLEVRRDHFILGDKGNHWPGVFAELEQRVVSTVPGSPAADFAHAFSTSTATEIAARQVVLLKAASPYYNYQLGTLCGIPRIELHGTADDWKWIRGKVADLRQFHMERRVKALAPVLDEFVAATEGKANPAFWKSYYKYASESGSSYVSGWINVFFVGEKDELLDVVLAPGFSWAAPPSQNGPFGAKNLPLALTTGSYKTKGAVDVDFIWKYLDQTIPMRWHAGFMGVSQDRKSMTLKPMIAWQVLRAKISSEAKVAAEYLGGLTEFDQETLQAIRHGFAIDPQTGFIRDVRPKSGGPLDSQFWKKAFPLMVRLERLDISIFKDIDSPAEKKAVVEAILSAPAVKVVRVPASLDEECLRMLYERKDWKIEFSIVSPRNRSD